MLCLNGLPLLGEKKVSHSTAVYFFQFGGPKLVCFLNAS